MTDMRLTPASQTIVLLWESLGPYHHDRLRALARSGYRVQAIELAETSQDYRWDRSSSGDYDVTTLSAGPVRPSSVKLAWRIVRASWQTRARHLFFCHYDKSAVLLAAVILRLAGRRVYTMVDSKFDDYPRQLPRECLKALFLLPYSGALVASRRSVEYLSFLGFGKRPIAQGYDTIDTGRFNRTIEPVAHDTPYAERPFVVVARLVPKKNLGLVLRAYAQLDSTGAGTRELHIIGYGPMLADLEQQTEELGIAARTRFLGQQPSSYIADALTRSLAMILASTEEQFGLVVNEALATGTPVIVSSNAGAVDELVDNLGNGLIINPSNEVDLVRAMEFMAGLSETEWRAMSSRASASAPRGHVRHFCDGVARLVRDASASS